MIESEVKSAAKGKSIPDFTLEDTSGNEVPSRGYYMRRNLVIVQLPETPDEAATRWIVELSKAMQRVPTGDATALVIAPAAWRKTLSELAADDGLVRFLVDTDGEAARRFRHPMESLQVLITDQYGVVYRQAIGTPGDAELDPAELDALRRIFMVGPRARTLAAILLHPRHLFTLRWT
jgi:peroxiredoxin